MLSNIKAIINISRYCRAFGINNFIILSKIPDMNTFYLPHFQARHQIKNLQYLTNIYIVISGLCLQLCTCWYVFTVVHMLILFNWHAPPPLNRFLHFMVLTYKRGEPNHSYKLLNTIMQQKYATMPKNY